MTQAQAIPAPPDLSTRRKVAFGLIAVFTTQFSSFLFINARNIATPGMLNDLDGMTLFAWLIALPALSGAASTLLFGKLSDIFGRRAITMLISLLVIRTIPEVSMDGRDT